MSRAGAASAGCHPSMGSAFGGWGPSSLNVASKLAKVHLPKSVPLPNLFNASKVEPIS